MAEVALEDVSRILAELREQLDGELLLTDTTVAVNYERTKRLSKLYTSAFHLATNSFDSQGAMYREALSQLDMFASSLPPISFSSHDDLLALDSQVRALFAQYKLGARKILFVFSYLDQYYVHFHCVPSLKHSSKLVFCRRVFTKQVLPELFARWVMCECEADELPLPPALEEQVKLWREEENASVQAVHRARVKWRVVKALNQSGLPVELVRIVCDMTCM